MYFPIDRLTYEGKWHSWQPQEARWHSWCCQVEVSLVIIIDLIISLYLFQSISAGGGFLGKFLLIETQFSEGNIKINGYIFKNFPCGARYHTSAIGRLVSEKVNRSIGIPGGEISGYVVTVTYITIDHALSNSFVKFSFQK